MNFESRLSHRFFSVVVILLALFSLAIYFYSVPLIKKTVYEIERNASRIALNNVFELANKMYFSLEGYRNQALESHKRQIRTVVSLVEAYIQDIFAQVEQGHLTEQQARTRIYEGLRRFTFGNNDYVWVASYDAVLLSHPDPRFHGQDAAELRNNDGELILPRVVALATADGEGFYQYKWGRLGSREEVDKISFVKNFPEWGFVVGAGLYLDDIDAEVRARKQQAVEELRQGLEEIKIAKTGYMYIFDADKNMLVHPNPNIDGTNFRDLKDPVTGRFIAEELIEVADTGRELHYQWDKPSDPGNYGYEKLSLVRHLEGFDWYIGSSVYEEELQRSSEVLSERILTITVIAMILASLLALFFVSRITAPIKRLAATAARVSAGDLSASSGIQRDDELGFLARTFDTMVTRLRENIQTLDSKVQERTQALEETNHRLLEAVESQRAAQQTLAQVEERQRLILDALPAQIAYVDRELRYRFVNQGYARMFKQSKEAIVGQPIEAVMGQQMVADIHDQLMATLAGQETVYEYRFRRDEGEVVTKRISIPDIDHDGRVCGILNLSLDITAEKDAERRLTEAQRMNAVGQLAGGLAHDFNNLLTVVLGNLISASQRFGDQEDLNRYLTPAIRASRRGADITNRLLAFSRRQPLTPSAIALASMVSDALVLLKGSLPSNLELRCQIDNPACRAFADPSQLENALVNLALNARDAMPKGGVLGFHVQERTIDSPVRYDEPVQSGDYVEICVSDTGSGFTPEALQQAFEPFFTTKPGGAGSGLGLSMVYGFVKQSQGYIRIDSEPGAGSTIRLLLPMAPEDLPEQGAASERLPSACGDFGGKLMLLVEDDPDVRAVVREQLTGLGFAVLEAGGADEAEELIETLDELYGMVSDVIMPGRLNGFDLARALHRRRPHCRILLITGYAYEHDPQEEGDSFTILRKPFEQQQLAKALVQARVAEAAPRESARPD